MMVCIRGDGCDGVGVDVLAFMCTAEEVCCCAG